MTAKKFATKQAIAGSSRATGRLNYREQYLGVIGNFGAGQTGLAGFELPNGDLGSLRVEVLDGYADELKGLGYAYNDVPRAAGPGSATEPSALSRQAMGSAGVLAWRRRTPEKLTN